MFWFDKSAVSDQLKKTLQPQQKSSKQIKSIIIMADTITFRQEESKGARSPSKRWSTVAQSDMAEVAQKLAGNYDNGKRMKDLQTRKLANTRTSINFGNEQVRFCH